MDADEDSIRESIGGACPIIKARVSVAIADHHYAEALARQFGADCPGNIESQIFFAKPTRAMGSAVRAAVGRIQDDCGYYRRRGDRIR